MNSILNHGRPPKIDKSVILGDAVRMIIQLRDEAQKLKESNESSLEKINEMKVHLASFFFHFIFILINLFYIYHSSVHSSCIVSFQNLCGLYLSTLDITSIDV